MWTDVLYTVGIDVGSNSIKTVLIEFDDNGKNEKILATDLNKIRKRDTKEVIRNSFEHVLSKTKLSEKDIAYVATTGEGEMVDFRRGHFYSMTSHSRGALFLNPDVRGVVDVGALHAKAFIMDDRSKVLGYKMTSQCASGSGQFLENISRYLGIPLEDVGELSMQSTSPEMVSGICAVLAETDVINMVSRGISASDILNGIHLSMGRRLIGFLRGLGVEGHVLITGGLASNQGFVVVMQDLADKTKLDVTFATHEHSVFAGAIGSAIWGAFRHIKLLARSNTPPKMLKKTELQLGNVTKNIGTMFLTNRDKYGDMPAFAQRENGEYRYWTWNELVNDICTFSAYLKSKDLQKGERIGIISRNYYHRLVVEMAVMSSGFVSVPIFHRYTEEMMADLIDFSDVKMLILVNYWRLEYLPVENKHLVVMERPEFPRKKFPFELQVEFFEDIMREITLPPVEKKEIEHSFSESEPTDTCLIMFTSGTTRFPKGVILTHLNILSQQAALRTLWKPEPGMRFLCYLPWHHSFGGLFERFFALHSGGCLAVDDSWGKDIGKLFKNFAEIKPHIYFSVPKIYKDIISQVLNSEEAEDMFFHNDLKFVFTAAAPLALSISDIFKKKNVPVVEGWGLTETSPCCTLTELLLDRKPGVVGFPIPGVEVKLGEENEILVRGVNVMNGYFKLPDVTSRVLDEDGWFKTGDIGEITPDGVKIKARKDRVFKLSNGEKVFPSMLERNIGSLCKFIKHAYIFGSGRDHPHALLFPNFELLESKGISALDEAECGHPDSSGKLSACFTACLHKINCHINIKFEHIERAVLVNQELSLEKNELTPSFKIIPRNIESNYKEYIDCVRENRLDDLPDDAQVIDVCDCHEVVKK